jgi:hypothetical protein
MFVIELIERKVGDIEAKVIPLDNLSPTDLDFIKGLGCGMTDEIYNPTYHINQMRNCDTHLVGIDTVRVFVVKQCILLWTILQGNIKKYPQMEQVCAWLNESKHTHKGELMFREREVHEVVERVGPEVLFGSSLEDALQTAPKGGTFTESTIPDDELEGNDMTDDDLNALFDENCMDLHAEPEKEEPPCEIILTDVVQPRFEVDFEVEEGDPTELSADDEFEMGFDALTNADEKDLVEEAV